MKLTIYHNPRCSKSRTTLALLTDRGHAPEIRAYLKDAASASELRDLADKLGLTSVRQMMRTGEAVYKDMGLKSVQGEDELIAALAANPILLERPIVVRGDKAAIGRPPENILALL